MNIIKRFLELRREGMNFIDAKVTVLKETGAIIDQIHDSQEEMTEAIDKEIEKEE